MPIRIAINGFGRIGRAAFKIALAKKGVDVVAINDVTDPKTLAHLLKYDTVYRTYEKTVTVDKNVIVVGSKRYPTFAEKDPAKLPWKKLKVDVVLECTGRFTNQETAGGHIKAGAKRVIISAPAKDKQTETLVFGTVHTSKYLAKGAKGKVVAMASCTTNCISPVMQVLESVFGIEKAMMTTIHAYTASQSLVDGPNKDWREGRAAAQNIIPTSTGAAIATAKVIPEIDNFFDGIAVRVPVVCGSISDITAVLKKNVTVQQVNAAFRKAMKNPLYKNILTVSDEPLVSSDLIGSPYSAVVDSEFTRVVGGNLVKVLAWYDNEWGYSMRLVEMAESIV